jgi:hypothetical protein
MPTWKTTSHAVDRFCERVDQSMSGDEAHEYIETAWPERCYPNGRTRDGHDRWALTKYQHCELVTKRERGVVVVVTTLGPEETVHDDCDMPPPDELEEMMRLYYAEAPRHPETPATNATDFASSKSMLSVLENQLEQARSSNQWAKTVRMLRAQHTDRMSYRNALRIAVRALQRHGDAEALADIAEIEPGFVTGLVAK